MPFSNRKRRRGGGTSKRKDSGGKFSKRKRKRQLTAEEREWIVPDDSTNNSDDWSDSSYEEVSSENDGSDCGSIVARPPRRQCAARLNFKKQQQSESESESESEPAEELEKHHFDDTAQPRVAHEVRYATATADEAANIVTPTPKTLSVSRAPGNGRLSDLKKRRALFNNDSDDGDGSDFNESNVHKVQLFSVAGVLQETDDENEAFSTLHDIDDEEEKRLLRSPAFKKRRMIVDVGDEFNSDDNGDPNLNASQVEAASIADDLEDTDDERKTDDEGEGKRRRSERLAAKTKTRSRRTMERRRRMVANKESPLLKDSYTSSDSSAHETSHNELSKHLDSETKPARVANEQSIRRSFYCCPICYVESYRRLDRPDLYLEDDNDDKSPPGDDDDDDNDAKPPPRDDYDDLDAESSHKEGNSVVDGYDYADTPISPDHPRDYDLELSSFSFHPMEVLAQVDPSLELASAFCFDKMKDVKDHLRKDHAVGFNNRDISAMFHRFHSNQADGLVQRWKKNTTDMKGLGYIEDYFREVRGDLETLSAGRQQSLKWRRLVENIGRSSCSQRVQGFMDRVEKFWSSFAIRSHRIWNALTQAYITDKCDVDDESEQEEEDDVWEDGIEEAIRHDLLDRESNNTEEEEDEIMSYIKELKKKCNEAFTDSGSDFSEERNNDDLVDTESESEQEKEGSEELLDMALEDSEYEHVTEEDTKEEEEEKALLLPSARKLKRCLRKAVIDDGDDDDDDAEEEEDYAHEVVHNERAQKGARAKSSTNECISEGTPWCNVL